MGLNRDERQGVKVKNPLDLFPPAKKTGLRLSLSDDVASLTDCETKLLVRIVFMLHVKMPLIIIVGWPGSGKTTIAKRIVEYFREEGKNCQLVSDDEILQTQKRNKIFNGEFDNNLVYGEQSSDDGLDV